MKNLRTYIIVLITTVFITGCSKNNELNPFTKQIEPKDFLSDKKYKTLIVEVDYMIGFKPSAAVIDNLSNFLSERLHKPKGIEFVLRSIPSKGINSYSTSDIQAIEEEYRNYFPKRSTLAAYIVFIDGGYIQDTKNSKVLGIAYGSTSVAIFQKTIQDYSGGVTQPSRSKLETAVVHHEFGHIFGLVNNGTPLQSDHQDINHGHHCNNSNCLMHYTAETSDIVGNLIGGSVPELDDNCLEDLRANGGK